MLTKKTTVLVTGANGQIGSELIVVLAKNNYNVFASDLNNDAIMKANQNNGLSIPFIPLDVSKKKEIETIIKKYNIDHVYHLAAMVSGEAGKYPMKAWNLNVGSLLNILEISKKTKIEEKKLLRIFWPSSMAAYGRNPEKEDEPRYELALQFDPLLPEGIYGATKVTGEALCSYYSRREGLDVRSIRYPGLISYNTLGGGGTTDYAGHMYFYAKRDKKYSYCFMPKDIKMEMMYLSDAIKATIKLMEANESKLKKGISYNLSGLTINPITIGESIKRVYPNEYSNFELRCYKNDPEERYKNALSWPEEIDDSLSESWGWNSKELEFDDPDKMTKQMLDNLDTTLLDKWEKDEDDKDKKHNKKPGKKRLHRSKIESELVELKSFSTVPS